MENKTVFRVGDEVYHFIYGQGKVSRTDLFGERPIRVIFLECSREFTWDGRYYKVEPPTLSFTPYTLEHGGFSQERPKPVIEKGTPIWVKASCSNNWVYGRFVEFDGIGRAAVEGFDGIGRYFPEYSLKNPLL